MSTRTLRVLLIEDEPSEQLLVQEILAGIEQFQFNILAVPGEEQAIAQFSSEIDLVILDYNLTDGNGLSCLRRLRQLQAQTPIVALSGTATPQIAAELLGNGADDYFSKLGLDPDQFRQGVCDAIARANAWKQRRSQHLQEVRSLLNELLTDFLRGLPNDFVQRLDQLSEAVRQTGLTPGQLERLFSVLTQQHGANATLAGRPLLLETVWRAFREDRSLVG